MDSEQYKSCFHKYEDDVLIPDQTHSSASDASFSSAILRSKRNARTKIGGNGDLVIIRNKVTGRFHYAQVHGNFNLIGEKQGNLR